MNTLNFTGALLLTVLLLFTVLTSSIKLFFTGEELEEMGIHFGPLDAQAE
jgi:hypothetical protein